MKLDLKGVLAIIIVCAVLVVGAYKFGLSQGSDERIAAFTPAKTGQTESVQNAHKFPFDAVHNSPNASNPNPHVVANTNGRKFSHFRVGNRNVKSMLADGDLVWIGTSGGVIRYNLKTDNYKLFDVSNGSLLSNGVFHLSKIDDKIYVGTYGGGLSVLNTKTNKWKNYNIPNGLADQFVYDVQKVANGDIWIATWSGANRVKGGDLDKLENWETFNVKNTNGGLPNDWVYGLAQGKNGEMWFATEKGLARYQNGKWKNWQHKDGLGVDYELVKNDIKNSRDPGNASLHHSIQKKEEGLSKINVAYNPNYIVSLEVDNKGVVWAGTWGAGLAKFDGKHWHNLSTRDGLPSDHIFSLYKDPSGNMWAGTSHGLVKFFKDDKFAIYTRQDGLYADNVFSMANAADGSIWMGSFGGVARIKGL